MPLPPAPFGACDQTTGRVSSQALVRYKIRQLVLCPLERRPPKLDLDVYPYLPRANVRITSAAIYMSLLSKDAA